MFPNITIVDGYKLRVAAFSCKRLGHVSQKTIDMTPHAGQYLRLWLEEDGTYSLDTRVNHFWQVVEFRMPEIAYEQVGSGEVDEQNEPIMVQQALPLDLTGMEIQRWELPN